jgi:hypothetical protein
MISSAAVDNDPHSDRDITILHKPPRTAPRACRGGFFVSTLKFNDCPRENSKTELNGRYRPRTPHQFQLKNPQKSTIGAVKSAAFRGDSFAEAVAAIMGLPLSDGEKAQAVRQLLAETQRIKP